MSADELRAKAALENGYANEAMREIEHGMNHVVDFLAMHLRATLYECTAEIIESLPNATERAELAALTGLVGYRTAQGQEPPPDIIAGWATGQAAALLAQRQAESEGK